MYIRGINKSVAFSTSLIEYIELVRVDHIDVVCQNFTITIPLILDDEPLPEFSPDIGEKAKQEKRKLGESYLQQLLLIHNREMDSIEMPEQIQKEKEKSEVLFAKLYDFIKQATGVIQKQELVDLMAEDVKNEELQYDDMDVKTFTIRQHR